MEWILTGLVIPIIFGVYNIVRDYIKDRQDKTQKISDIETRLVIVEQKVTTIEDDITEIKELREEIKKIQIDLSKILTLLDERTNKGQ